MRLAKFAGRFALFLTGMALLTVVSLFVVGAYLTTWPVHRISPRNQRLTAIMELATALFGAARAFGINPNSPDTTKATKVTEATETKEDELTSLINIVESGPIPGWSMESAVKFLNWVRENYGSYELKESDLRTLMIEYFNNYESTEGGD